MTTVNLLPIPTSERRSGGRRFEYKRVLVEVMLDGPVKWAIAVQEYSPCLRWKVYVFRAQVIQNLLKALSSILNGDRGLTLSRVHVISIVKTCHFIAP